MLAKLYLESFKGIRAFETTLDNFSILSFPEERGKTSLSQALQLASFLMESGEKKIQRGLSASVRPLESSALDTDFGHLDLSLTSNEYAGISRKIIFSNGDDDQLQIRFARHQTSPLIAASKFHVVSEGDFAERSFTGASDPFWLRSLSRLSPSEFTYLSFLRSGDVDFNDEELSGEDQKTLRDSLTKTLSAPWTASGTTLRLLYLAHKTLQMGPHDTLVLDDPKLSYPALERFFLWAGWMLQNSSDAMRGQIVLLAQECDEFEPGNLPSPWKVRSADVNGW